MDGEDTRGRESTEKSEGKLEKDGKGNVLVSVRVRPDAASDGARPEHEWMVDGRRSLISYKGKEAGEYIYGKQLCLPAASRVAHCKSNSFNR